MPSILEAFLSLLQSKGIEKNVFRGVVRRGSSAGRVPPNAHHTQRSGGRKDSRSPVYYEGRERAASFFAALGQIVRAKSRLGKFLTAC